MSRILKAIPPRAQGGFTLLELIVVMALIGLMLAVAVPSIGRQLNNRAQQSELELIMSELFAMPAKAMYEGRKFEFPETLRGPTTTPLNLPKGWVISFTPPLVITAVPACTATSITIRYGEQPDPSAVYAVEQGTCKLRLLNAPAAP